MSIFEPVTLKWGEQSIKVPPNRTLMLIAAAENIVTLQELSGFAMRQTVPFARVSMAYGAVLRAAGLDVSDEEVYGEICAGQDAGARAIETVNGLMLLMVPPRLRANIPGKDAGGPGKEETASDSSS